MRRLYLIALSTTAIFVLGIVSLYTLYQPSVRSESPDGKYVEVVDYLNRSVKVLKNVGRVVAIGPGTLRLITYLNATDLIVGVEQVEVTWSVIGRDYAMAHQQLFKNLSIIGQGGPNTPPNPEMLKVVKPQLIIMTRTYAELYLPDKLSEEVGVPVLVIDYGVAGYLDVDSFKYAMSLLGKVLGREERASQLSRYLDHLISDLRNRTSEVTSRPKVYVGAVSYKGAQPFTSTQVDFPPLRLLNTSSIVDSLSTKGGFIQVDFEYIMKMQPDYVFVDENNLKVVLDDFIKDRSKYCILNAFKDGKVYGTLPYNYYHTNVATALANAYFIGKVLYPDKFADIDVAIKADEIFKAFVGKPLYREFINGGYPGFTQLDETFKCG